MTPKWNETSAITEWVNSSFDLDVCKIVFTGTTVHFATSSTRSLFDLFVRRICDYPYLASTDSSRPWNRRSDKSARERYETRRKKYEARGFTLNDVNPVGECQTDDHAHKRKRGNGDDDVEGDEEDDIHVLRQRQLKRKK